MPDAVELPGGRRATYEVIGDGPPLLMFPGGPGSAADYLRPQAEIAGERFTCYLLDPHGSGGSTPPAADADYSPEGHVRFYDEVRRALGLGDVSVYGHSFGTAVAFTWSAFLPEITVRCIAVAPFAVGAEVDDGETMTAMERALERYSGASWYPEARDAMDGWTERVLAAEDPGEVDDMMRAVTPFYFADPDRPDVAAVIEDHRRTVKLDLRAGKAWEGGLFQTIDLRPILPRIVCPTTVVCGELDFISGPVQARPVADAISDAVLVIIPDCGHFPAEEAPDSFREALADA
ncbi:MAG TPA: alpha/beta hydrolase [Gaiellaceae bacterium]|jgi:pimeloyl-ACP methyl ester carboxylesterase